MLILTGCTSKSQAPVRPSPAQNQPSSSLYLAETAFQSGQNLQALNLVNSIISKDPRNVQALFLQGLIYLKSGDFEQGRKSFAEISPADRTTLVESCIELKELQNEKNQEPIRNLAQLFFPDCLEELNEKLEYTEPHSMAEEEIIRYGQLLDKALEGEDDPEIRRLKEEAFLKQYQLTGEQLDEITSRYLDYLADQK